MTGFSKEMQAALHEDAAKLSAMTGEEHTVEFFSTPNEFAGEIAYALTKRLVIDMPTARAAVDEAMTAIRSQGMALISGGNQTELIAELVDALEHAREILWNSGFRENDIQPIRDAITKAVGP